jgi:hypothetical protein
VSFRRFVELACPIRVSKREHGTYTLRAQDLFLIVGNRLNGVVTLRARRSLSHVNINLTGGLRSRSNVIVNQYDGAAMLIDDRQSMSQSCIGRNSAGINDATDVGPNILAATWAYGH